MHSMMRVVDHGDVQEIELSTPFSRAAGVKVSVFLTGDTLVDTGFPRAAPVIARLLDERRVRGSVVTHWHEDHSGNLAVLAARGVPIGLTDATAARLPETTRLPFYRWVFWGHAPAPPRFEPYCLPDELEVVPTPGHSDDHRAIWHPATATIFTGDLVLGVRVTAVLADENPRQSLDSVRRVLALEPVRIFDAHRGLIREPKGLLAAKIAWMEDTIGSIEHLIDQGLDDRPIRNRVLGREDSVGRISFGQTSKLNFVRAVRRTARTR